MPTYSTALVGTLLAIATVVFAQNPRQLPGEWEQYGLGDPYVLKFNGVYYLYVSTRDTDIGVKVWHSPDLANWTYGGLCTTDSLTKGAYAPEVVYWNGYFYMYTSPAGKGHYVLRSGSPLGPFTVQTKNLGRTIDGHVFIDDDGSWYFYHAGSAGIQAARMPSPTSFGESVNTGAFMNGWTEGASVVKRNGIYYMTYTGTHVFSPAYRVDYATGTTSPVSDYQPSSTNPVLLRTEGATVGLGHNCIVVGPNLDTYYMLYHNLEGRGIVGPLRHLNIDQIAWNGDNLRVLGPTTTPQPAPELPTFYDRFAQNSLAAHWTTSGGDWRVQDSTLLQTKTGNATLYRLLNKVASAADYTAEFNLRQLRFSNQGDAKIGVIFSYQNDKNYGMALLNPAYNRLETQLVVNGDAQGWQWSNLPKGYDYTQWHTIRVEKQGTLFKLYVDNMQKQTRDANLPGGRIGYVTENNQAAFSFIAFSNQVNGSSARTAYKPVPGIIEAVHCLASEDETESKQLAKQASDKVDKTSKIRTKPHPHGSYQLTVPAGRRLTYRVNVAAAATYDIDFMVNTSPDGALLQLWNGTTALTDTFRVVNNNTYGGRRTTIKQAVSLPAGPQEIQLAVCSGTIDFYRMQVYERAPVTAQRSHFATPADTSQWTTYEGKWSVRNETYQVEEGFVGKALTGDFRWTDYAVEADVKLAEGAGNAGILVRAANPANGLRLHQRNAHAVQGYYASISDEAVYLEKPDYKPELLAVHHTRLPVNQWHRLKVAVQGKRIQVFVNDLQKAIIDYYDDSQTPFLHGKAGVMAGQSTAWFDKFTIYAVPLAE